MLPATKKEENELKLLVASTKGKTIFEIVTFKYVNIAYSIKPNMNSLQVNMLLVLDKMKNIQTIHLCYIS